MGQDGEKDGDTGAAVTLSLSPNEAAAIRRAAVYVRAVDLARIAGHDPLERDFFRAMLKWHEHIAADADVIFGVAARLHGEPLV